MYFDLELKSASSGTKSLPLQAGTRKNFLKHMPTNKTHESVMRLSTTQTSLGKCTVSPGHLLLAHTSDPMLCLSAHKDGACGKQRLRQKTDLRVPAPLDKQAVAHAWYCMLPNKRACMAIMTKHMR